MVVTGLDWAGLGYPVHVHSLGRPVSGGGEGIGRHTGEVGGGGEPAASSFTHKVRRGMSGRGSAGAVLQLAQLQYAHHTVRMKHKS